MKTGVLTYHSAYNYGSVLQAYAMQKALASLNYPADLINYRMDEQRRFYQPLYRTNFGVKTLMKDLLQVPCHTKRQLRAERFEDFFRRHLLMTEEFSEPEEVASNWQQYDTIISGSDQIWNKHSCELAHNDWRYMEPYLLKGFEGRKISYASSVGNMTDDELQRILPELRQFDALSFREAMSAERMADLLDRLVETVLDPTFLLTKNEWIKRLQLQRENKEGYILAYFLRGPKKLAQLLPALSRIAKKLDCKVKLVTPFAYLPYPNKRIEYHLEYGPIEFMNALYNAESVVTDSYHGTILSVNFDKEFYSICMSGGAEFRKTDLLNRLGLQERIIHDAAEIPELNLSPIDYTAVYARLADMRQHSMDYLIASLSGTSRQ